MPLPGALGHQFFRLFAEACLLTGEERFLLHTLFNNEFGLRFANLLQA